MINDKSLEKSFEREKYKRIVNECDNIDALKLVTLQLIDAYFSNVQFIQNLLFKQL
jgi:hypothetical protein